MATAVEVPIDEKVRKRARQQRMGADLVALQVVDDGESRQLPAALMTLRAARETNPRATYRLPDGTWVRIVIESWKEEAIRLRGTIEDLKKELTER